MRGICDTGDDSGEAGLRINDTEPRRANQADRDGGALGAAVGLGEQPRLATAGDGAQCPFGSPADVTKRGDR